MSNTDPIISYDDKLKEALAAIDFDESDLDTLEGKDKTQALIKIGMQFITNINQVEVTIHEIEKFVRILIPEPVEDIKVLLARIEDIDPNKIDELSLGFIKQAFEVNGRELKVSFPEVGEVNDLEFYRIVIRQLKVFDESTGMAIEILKNLREKFNKVIPDDVKKLLGNIEALDDWMVDYFKEKVTEVGLTEEQHRQYEEKLKYIEYSYTLEPIIKNVRQQIESKGSNSILYGFRHNAAKVLATAIGVCKDKNILFPFQMYDNIEEKLLGDKYKEYHNLFSFLIARYIKFKRNEINDNEKIFLSNLNSHLVIIKRAKDMSRVEKTASRLRQSIDELLSLVTK